MQIFEYPYVIITILVMFFVAFCLVGLYFTVKSMKTAKGVAGKGFCGVGKIESDFEKSASQNENRCVIYVSISLDSMERLHSESKAARVFEQIKRILLRHFSIGIGGETSLLGKESFVSFNGLKREEVGGCIDKCFEELNDLFVKHGAVNSARVHFGYHCTSSGEVTFKTALSRAKQACSMAERDGVLYCEWDSSNGKEFERKIKIENSIENEIDKNRFFLEYQPILDAENDRIMGAEVLARLNSSTEGVLTPRDFLGAVNNVGLNDKFDYYIFEKNCKWISSDKENRAKYIYTINFSRNTLCDATFPENIMETVEKYDVPYSCIAIEILEDKNLDDGEKRTSVNNLKRLKEKGVLILLDDFGKGYTGFGDLADFDINIVKIDKSITQNAVTDTGFLILKNIIRTANDLGFKTLCEGIETEEHKKAAVEAGASLLQGYYFYRPMPVTRFETLFEKE